MSPMKKTLLLIAALSAASLSFAGSDKCCGDKAKADGKCVGACCKDAKEAKDCKTCCGAKATDSKDAPKDAAKTEKR